VSTFAAAAALQALPPSPSTIPLHHPSLLLLLRGREGKKEEGREGKKEEGKGMEEEGGEGEGKGT
jgi:hypothetical protein